MSGKPIFPFFEILKFYEFSQYICTLYHKNTNCNKM